LRLLSEIQIRSRFDLRFDLDPIRKSEYPEKPNPGPVELPEAARLRDRTKKERDRERDREREHRERDRLHSRSKRRRGERLIMVHDGGDESSEESVNDDEEYDDVKTIPPANNIFSSPLSNHHHQRKNFPPPSKNFRSPPSPALPVPSWKAAADEMIGVAVPRKARSACTKRPHESRTSNATGERSPARVLASPSPPSPSSSNVSARKKPLGTKQKPLPQKVSSPVAVQDEIEIEIAEVLYGMMRMPTSSKQEEKTTVGIKAKVSSPISITLAANSSSTNVSAIAPKRKKQRHVKYEEDENSSGLPSRVTKLEAEAPLRSQKPKPLLKEDGGSAAIVESEEKKKPRTVDEAEPHTSERSCELKLDLDKSGHAGVMNNQHVQKQPPPQQQQHFVPDKIAQANSLPLHMSMPGWPGGLPTMGYMPSTQGVVPTDTSSLSSAPPHLLFNQPRPKRCATHCYIARNIQSHQQFTKMNPFWPAAIGSAPLYGTKACNLSLMPPTELQGTVLGRSPNQIQDENSQSTSKSSDTAQRNQILLQQALPPGAAANNIMHGPTFIFPVGQQPTMAAASVRPPNSGNTASSGATASANSMNGSASAAPAGAPTMTFSYPGMPGNETQYLAIMQNNGYPFPVSAHVGTPPAYRGAPGQPIPFFNGSFYSSQMIQSPFSQPQKQQQQSGQILQSHAPNNQNGSVSSGSSAAQKHLQNHQLRPHGNSDGYPTHKVQSQVLTFQQRQQPRENATQHSDTVGENSPSAADSRGSRSNVAYGQNYGMQMQPTNLGLMSSAAPGGGVVVSSSNHGEKKSQQQVSKAGAESFQSQGCAMTFATFNGVSSTAQNHATFQSLPEAARQGYQMMAANVAAQQKMNYNAPSEGKSGSNATAKTMEEQRKTSKHEGASGKASGVNGGQSIAFSSKHDLGDASVSAVTSGSIVDTSRLLNLGSAQQQSISSMPHHNLQQKMKQHMQQQNQHLQQHMQRSQSQQPYTMYLQKQQQYATSVAASAAKNKGPVVSNGTGVADHNISISPVGTAKFPNANSGFPQNLVESPQWKSNSPRTTNTSQAQSPSILSPSSSVAASSSPRNVSHKQQSRPQQSQISFAANSKPTATGSPMQQVQGGTNNQAPSSPMLVGSPSTPSVSKTTGGSPRTTAPASSAVNKAGQASSTTHSSSQPSKNLQPASVASSAAVGRNNGSSVLGNQTTSSGSKSQQQQQHLPKHGTTGSVTATSDPAKAMVAAGNNIKGGGKTQQHQLGPPGFGLPYVHAVPSAVQVKPVDQKQQSGE
ncbi:hypothetical protein F2Q70_00010298, partial [Brassica cretica]